MEQFTRIKCRLSGLRPLMFDRYAGDNATSLPVKEKLYLSPEGHLTLPSINLFSLLAAENTKSVCRQMFGKQGKNIALGIASYVNIDPFEIPIRVEGGRIATLEDWGTIITEAVHVARVKGGIPNPKRRPKLSLPWSLEFEVQYQENSYCTLPNLRNAFEKGGILGIGTFRPYFGRYELTGWDLQ